MVTNESDFRVKVAVRVRPFLPREKAHDSKSCVAIHRETSQIVLGDRRTFKYDFVFGPKTQQDDLYHACIEPMLNNVFDGYNVTIFAYGQTSSGKTYTMTGGHLLSMGEKDFGIIPRAVQTIFDTLQSRKDRRVNISVSYLEIYKDDIIDLLDVQDKAIDVRDDAIGNTVIIGASEHVCHSMNDVVSLLKKGSTSRHTGATQMNDESSRSHAIFTLHIEQRHEDPTRKSTMVQASFDGLVKPVQSTLDESYLSAKLHFVDLAGSERVARTHNTGERFQESIRINSGLLALGNVVSALSDPKKRAGGHIPYRDSKLTRLLKDSLGGNAKTLMITCLSPCTVDLDESLNALKYAHRASQIRNKPIKNVDPNARHFIEMQSEIMHLREELERQRSMISHNGHSLNHRRSTTTTSHDHARRLIQTAFVYFQQLNQSEELNDEQKHWIQAWMNTVSKESSEELYNDLITGRVADLESALHSAQDELRSESRMRVQRETVLDQLHEQLQAKEEELKRMRLDLDQLHHQRKEHEDTIANVPTSVPNRAKSAPAYAAAKNLSVQPRNIQSSPAAFTMNYVIERFHGQSLALAHSQEELEELHSNDGRRLVRQGTYRVLKSRMTTTSILPQEEDIQTLTQSTVQKQRLVEQATRNMRVAESQVQDLGINIQMKERLIKSVFDSTKDVKNTNTQYEEHIRMLEREMDKAKLEYHDLQKKIQQLSMKSTSEKSKLDSDYRKKCELAKARVESLQRKEKQYREFMITLTGTSEKRNVDLQAALFRMKQHYETAQKRIREETDLKNKFEQDLIREQQHIQELTLQNEQQQKILKLKTEGLVAAQRRLRGAPANGHTLAEATSTFDLDMERLIAERKELDSLRQDVQKREELIQKRELFLHERTQLEAKKTRASQMLDKPQSNHQQVREELLKQRHAFAERVQHQSDAMTAAEERRLIEIDEGIEAIDIAIDYQNNLITKRERDVQQSIRASQGSDSPLFKISQLNENECKELCRKLFDKVIGLKEDEHRTRREMDDVQCQLVEQTEIVAELQSRLQSLSHDNERRFISIQQTHEDEKQLLLGQLQESSNQITDLEKDLYFYKHKTRELRKSLATSTNSATDTTDRRNEPNPFLLNIGQRSRSSHHS